MLDENINTFIENLTRNFAHEVKNPLTTIKGYTQLIELKSKDEFTLKAVAIMHEQVEVIEQQFDDLYNIFQNNAIKERTFDLISDIQKSIKSSLFANNIHLHTELDQLQLTSDQSKCNRLLDIFLTAINIDYFADTIIRIDIDQNSLSFTYQGIFFDEQDLKFLYLPYSSKALFTKGFEYYELSFICMKLGYKLVVTSSPDIKFSISLT